MAQCKKMCCRWTDDCFPPCNASICPGREWKECYNKMEWKRADKIPAITDDEGCVCMFGEGCDIKIGEFKNQALVNAMSNLKHVIHKCCPQRECNEQGVYCFEFGTKCKVMIDDCLLTKNMCPCFSTAKGGHEMWMALMEKAYAKHLGAFCRLEGCDYTHCAMRDFTGAPSVNITKDKFDFKMIQEAMGMCFILSAMCKMENNVGICLYAAYPILECAQVKDKSGKECCIIKVRNPWGKEYTGKWKNAGGECWTPEARQKCKVADKDDGTFWCEMNDWDCIDCCKYNEKCTYSCIESTKKCCVYKVRVPKKGNYTFAVSQKDCKMFPPYCGYEY